MPRAPKKDIGRPGKFTPKMLRDILNAMLKPYTGIDDVAKKYKISVQAIFRWQKAERSGRG